MLINGKEIFINVNEPTPKQKISIDVATRLDKAGINFLLAWSFNGSKVIEGSITEYKRKYLQSEILGVFSSNEYSGYSVIACKGIPTFQELTELGLPPIKKYKSKWQASEIFTKGNPVVFVDNDNFKWVSLPQLIQLIESDKEIEFIYK